MASGPGNPPNPAVRGGTLSRSELAGILETVMPELHRLFAAHGLSATGLARSTGPLDGDIILALRKAPGQALTDLAGPRARELGLGPQHAGIEFSWSGRRWRLIGVCDRRRKNALIVEGIPSGQSAYLPTDACWEITRALAGAMN